MGDVLGLAIVTLFAGAYCAAAIAWLAGAILLVRTLAHRRPGVRLWSRELLYVPLTLVFRPALLTDRGRLCRSQLGWALLAFVGALGTGLALGGLMRLLD